MKSRISMIEDSFDISTSGTKIIDLAGKDPISRLVIFPKITNPNAYTAQGHPDECISKIELVDGHNVIFSLKGTEARALSYYTQKKVPLSCLNYMALQWSMCPIEIYFGRYLWDREYGFDPKKFTNPQLKITHDLDAAMDTTSTGYITVTADIFEDEPPSFTKCLMSTELQNITQVASAVNYVDFPEDYPIRFIMLHQFSDSQAPEYNVASFKLTEAMDKKILWDGDMEDYQQIMATIYPPWTEKVYGRMAATDVYFWITPAFEQTILFVGTDDSDGVLQMSAATGGQKRKTEASALTVFEAVAYGHAPHGTTPIPIGDIMNPADAWNVGQKGGGRLKLTNHASVDTTPTMDIVIQQYLTY